jgi:hypothetical protein
MGGDIKSPTCRKGSTCALKNADIFQYSELYGCVCIYEYAYFGLVVGFFSKYLKIQLVSTNP